MQAEILIQVKDSYCLNSDGTAFEIMEEKRFFSPENFSKMIFS